MVDSLGERVGLTFARSSLETKSYPQSLRLLTKLGQFTNSLHEYGVFRIVDWGWPQLRWSAQHGLVYDLTRDMPVAHEQWKKAGLTFKLRHSFLMMTRS